jgi:hypothetical protein
MMNWARLWRDIGIGGLVASVLAAWVPPDMLRMMSGKRSSAPSRGHEMPASNSRRHHR